MYSYHLSLYPLDLFRIGKNNGCGGRWPSMLVKRCGCPHFSLLRCFSNTKISAMGSRHSTSNKTSFWCTGVLPGPFARRPKPLASGAVFCGSKFSRCSFGTRSGLVRSVRCRPSFMQRWMVRSFETPKNRETTSWQAAQKSNLLYFLIEVMPSERAVTQTNARFCWLKRCFVEEIHGGLHIFTQPLGHGCPWCLWMCNPEVPLWKCCSMRSFWVSLLLVPGRGKLSKIVHWKMPQKWCQ